METLNIGSESNDPRAQALSNFSAHSFAMDRMAFASVEGLIQGIKYPSDDPIRPLIFASVGIKAKRFGRHARLKKVLADFGGCYKFVWWRGVRMNYGSHEHHLLIRAAIRAKFQQNRDALEALLATRGMKITHDLGHPESLNTSLLAHLFCKFLTEIREEYPPVRA